MEADFNISLKKIVSSFLYTVVRIAVPFYPYVMLTKQHHGPVIRTIERYGNTKKDSWAAVTDKA